MKGSDTINCQILKKGKCEITQYYNENHKALDIVGENYTLDQIVAHSDGKIIELKDGLDNDRGSNSYGNYIKLEHKNGYQSLYAHLEKGIKLKKGTNIKKGEILGNMGDSGNAYGKHLHFEIIKNNEKINPIDYIKKDLPDNQNDKEQLKYQIGQKVKINSVYISSTSEEKLIPLINEGKITKIIENARNPYLLEDGKIGWINDDSIISLINITKNLSNTSYKGFSLVYALKQINIDSSFENRSKIAKLNGINNYTGTSIQNINLLNLLKQGKLKNKI